MKRGEVWLVRLFPTVGRDEAGTRPALVVSSERFNEGRAGLAIVIPITTRDRRHLPRVPVDPVEGGLGVRSWAVCEQPRCISKEQAIRCLGKVSDKTTDEITPALRWLLDL